MPRSLQGKIDIKDPNHIDIGCCIKSGSWILQENGKNGKYKWSAQNSLLTFFVAFLSLLQRNGTVSAMEMEKYYNGFSS